MLMEPYHYFASSVAGWTADEDLETCLRHQREEDAKEDSESIIIKGCRVYRVPGADKEATYEINFYVPQVEGIELVAEITYEKTCN